MAAATPSYQEKALALEQEANTSYTPQGNRRFAELTMKAANFYIAAKKHKEAADAYSRAAQCYTSLFQPTDGVTTYIKASNAYKECDLAKAAQCLEFAVDYYVGEGQFGTAAKYRERMAGMYEKLEDSDNAIMCWEAAADFCEIENAAMPMARCLEKVAEHAALARDYGKAEELFRKVHRLVKSEPGWASAAYEYLFNARLCLLLMAGRGPVSVEAELRSHANGQLLPSSKPASMFMHNILATFRRNDPDKFSQVVNDYNRIHKLTEWQAAMMLRIGELFPEGDDTEEEQKSAE